MYLSNSTKMTTNTETAMLSSLVEAVELPICDGGCQVKCRQAGQVHQISYTETSTTKYVIQGQVASEGKWTSLKRKYQAYIVCGFIWHKLWPHSQKCRLCDRFQVLSSPITLTTIDWSASGWKMILLHWWVGGWGVGQESVRVTIPTCLCGHCPNKHVFS